MFICLSHQNLIDLVKLIFTFISLDNGNRRSPKKIVTAPQRLLIIKRKKKKKQMKATNVLHSNNRILTF